MPLTIDAGGAVSVANAELVGGADRQCLSTLT
jgi:hypothetical protein